MSERIIEKWKLRLPLGETIFLMNHNIQLYGVRRLFCEKWSGANYFSAGGHGRVRVLLKTN